MSYPTSRKKYYLALEISSEWTDSHFIRDLQEFITSKCNQNVYDIFIENSERIGYFSVRNKETSDKLIKSFATNYVSSGRKPSVSVQKISKHNFQIKLGNINNVMTNKEFETWILSVNYSSFDIQLFPPNILKPSNKCILSFRTTDAAIAVKKTLDNIQFRQFPLYFTHWYVPRKSKSALPWSKLALNGLQLQLNGYSTGSDANSPIPKAGPLYLRDSNVPQPPKRAPPAPPVLDNVSDNEKSELDTVSDKNRRTLSKIKSQSATELLNHSQIAFINSMHLEVKRLREMNEKFMLQNVAIASVLDEEKQYGNYMNEKYNIMYNNYVNLSEMNKILLWDVTDIIQWICQLENGWFYKYKDILLYNLNQTQMNGVMLSKITQMELCKFGIIDVNDQYLLLNHIGKLFQKL